MTCILRESSVCRAIPEEGEVHVQRFDDLDIKNVQFFFDRHEVQFEDLGVTITWQL